LLEKMSKDNMKYYQTHLSPKATANIIANILNEKGM
jgi:hypothetical protein